MAIPAIDRLAMPLSSTSPAVRGDATRARVRLESIDVLRGVVMIIMALDHVRDFFGGAAVNPTNLATTTVPLFATRWITHFCAPTFFLLTGTGAYLSGRRRGKAGLSRLLVTRGLWMIALDAVILRCLAKKPADRFASAAEMASALHAVPRDAWDVVAARAWWREHHVAEQVVPSSDAPPSTITIDFGQRGTEPRP